MQQQRDETRGKQVVNVETDIVVLDDEDDDTQTIVKPETALVLRQKDTPPSCCICYRNFECRNDEFRLHLLSHLELFVGKPVCPNCRVDCGDYERMVDHFMMVHGEVDKLVCPHPTCIRSFRTERTLNLHARKHNG